MTRTFHFDGLVDAIKEFVKITSANNKRIIPINVTTANAPSDTGPTCDKTVLERTQATFHQSSSGRDQHRNRRGALQALRKISGETSMNSRLVCEGPQQKRQDTAKHTLTLSNHMNNLEELGVDPADYVPDGFLRQFFFGASRFQCNARVPRP